MEMQKQQTIWRTWARTASWLAISALIVLLPLDGESQVRKSQRVAPPLATWDSLFLSGDSAGFASAVSRWNGTDSSRVGVYRGILGSWAEIAKLRISLDSASSALAARDSIAPPILDVLSAPEAQTPPPSPERIQSQLVFIALLFALFLVPKLLQRYRIPGAITSLLMGVGASALGWFPHDPTLNLLSTLGIVALFLFAGLDIDAGELRANVKPLVLHAVIWTALAAIVAAGAAVLLGASLRVASLLSLALVTPSTGFILSSLKSFGLSDTEQRTVRTYAVGSELIALAALFFVLQATSVQHLALAIVAMAGVIVIIPLAFRLFASSVAPYAPKSEFAFLLMVAVVCAYATRLLGVYYLVGAFLVGVAAQRFRASHPAMSSERMVDALESFGSVFIPFYFFHAGTEIVSDHLTMKSVLIGLALVAGLVPLRIAVISLHRRLALGESFAVSRRIGSAMVPTLVFTLVIASILTDRFGLSAEIGGALVLYTILNTTLPAFVLHSKPADFGDVEALPVEGPISDD
jgi:Kef-type K+ transport system membrane component KefB